MYLEYSNSNWCIMLKHAEKCWVVGCAKLFSQSIAWETACNKCSSQGSSGSLAPHLVALASGDLAKFGIFKRNRSPVSPAHAIHIFVLFIDVWHTWKSIHTCMYIYVCVYIYHVHISLYRYTYVRRSYTSIVIHSLGTSCAKWSQAQSSPSCSPKSPLRSLSRSGTRNVPQPQKWPLMTGTVLWYWWYWLIFYNLYIDIIHLCPRI